MLDNLVRANVEANRHPRDSRDIPKSLELDVDCTDPYGRYEIDADGHGGSAPADMDQDGNPNANAGVNNANLTNNNAKSVPKVSLKRITVFVETSPPVQSQQTIVLSAAVSSTKRIRKDCHVAYTIAKRLDVARSVPSDINCDAVLSKLFPTFMESNLIQMDGVTSDTSGSISSQMMEDALDVTIAYLRRVHLFTFYNGCTFSDNVGAVLGGSHPASAIHVRLKGADEILKKAREENADMYDDLGAEEDQDSKTIEDTNNTSDKDTTKAESATAQSAETKDMLVMRLDDSIDRVQTFITESMETSCPFVVNESVDAVASEIQTLEEKSKLDWIHNHSVIDNDGRARCSFHFCNKLFKDKNFLQKHLLKKHPEFLQAEMAKSHDSYMMDWWDKEEKRPVPQVCIDCGPKFGIRLSPAIGAESPTVHDPEPELWQEEQERIRKVEEEEKRYREKHAAMAMEYQRRNEHNNDMVDNGGGGDSMMNPNAPASNFVDVDDMKDEKVELSFKDVNVVAPTNGKTGKKKKKKKKKKLL